MVKIMEKPIKMDDLGGKTTIFGNTHIITYYLSENLETLVIKLDPHLRIIEEGTLHKGSHIP